MFNRLFLLFSKNIQYLCTYTLNGTKLGTNYTVAFDFPINKIGNKANQTTYELYLKIKEVHNYQGLSPSIGHTNEIGIISLARIN